ncbi:MAG: hypothetical protein Q4Q28_08695 [Bacteroidales bacterium]|nr:hypothetical protein [Bacteroidales bacterium]MEE0908357.1 hypothetical protein [Muribaculaceae bacterium]
MWLRAECLCAMTVCHDAVCRHAECLCAMTVCGDGAVKPLLCGA